MAGKSRQFNWLINCANITIAVLGSLRVHYATRWGAWAFSDSANYFSAARNLAAGQGMVIQKAGGGFVYFQQFPPLYPAVLGAGGWLLGDFFIAARWINIIAIGLFLFLVGRLTIERIHNPLAGLAVPILLLVSPMMTANFTGAMTEPIFFVLMALSFYLVFRLLDGGSILCQLAYIAVSMLLPITRYAGLSLVAANFLILLLFTRKPFRQRAAFGLVSMLFSAIPTALWVLHLFGLTERIGGRRVQIAATFMEDLLHGSSRIFDVLKSYLPYDGAYEAVLSPQMRLILVSGFLTAAIAVSVWLIRKKWTEPDSSDPMLQKFLALPIHVSVFLVFIAFSYSITRRSYVIDQRQLSPLIPMIIIIACWSSSVMASAVKSHRVAVASVFLVLFLIIFRYNFFTSRSLLNKLHHDGFGYTSREYQHSGIIEEIKKIPEDKTIISNTAGFILLHDNRMPIQVDHFHQRMYGSGDAYGEAIFREKRAALVIIRPDFNNYYGDNAAALYNQLTTGLQLSFEDTAGAIFYFSR